MFLLYYIIFYIILKNFTLKSDLYSIIPGKKTTRTLIKNDVLNTGKTEENKTDYLLFCEHFVPCVIGKILVRTSLGQEKNYSEYCTNSDETMALLIYENNYDNWLNIAMFKAGGVKELIKYKQIFCNDGKGKGNTYN